MTPRPRLRPNAFLFRWLWRAGVDTLVIAKRLGIDETEVWRRAYKYRQRGWDLPKRTRGETCAKRRQATAERVCGCGKVFTLSVTHAIHNAVPQRQCELCRRRGYGDEFVRV